MLREAAHPLPSSLAPRLLRRPWDDGERSPRPTNFCAGDHGFGPVGARYGRTDLKW